MAINNPGGAGGSLVVALRSGPPPKPLRQGEFQAGASKPRRPRIQSVARAASILFAIAASRNGLATKEISAQLGLSIQTTYHLLHTLLESGLIARNDRKLFVVGFRAAVLSDALRRHLTAPEQLAPLVRAIARETGETANAAGWQGNEIVTLSVALGDHPSYLSEAPYVASVNAHARAAGKLLLAYTTPEARNEYLASHPMRRCTPNTITTIGEMNKECERIRQQGYSLDREELILGLRCIAVPVAAGYSPYALGLAAPKERFEKNLKKYLRILTETASSMAATGG